MATFGHENVYFDRPAYRKDMWEKAGDPAFWLNLNKHLQITENPLAASLSYAVQPKEIGKLQQTLKKDGYFQTKPVIPRATCRSLARAITNLIANGIHPLFAIVYDEFWQILQNLSGFVSHVGGEEFRILPDFWVWAVSPKYAPTGWGPHRDHQHEKPFFDDGRPAFINLWIALTDANPSNGCIYILPKSLDSNLPEHPEIRKVERPQNIRALPVSAGCILGWDQYLLHWGGRCNSDARKPRISLACYFQSVQLDSSDLIERSAKLDLNERLCHISNAFLRYDHHFKFPPELKKAVNRFWAVHNFFKVQNHLEIKKMFGDH